MRGILFTEYFDFVAAQAGEEALEEVLAELDGKITGAYTSVGNYSFAEFANIHTLLCSKLDASPEDMARQYGENLLHRFRDLFPSYFEDVANGIVFLEKVGDHIHEEVMKLYPDAKPPVIKVQRINGEPSFLIYQSHRPLAAVSEGLASECLRFFGDPYKLGQQFKSGDAIKFPLEPIGG
ncbi:MAG: heme NO-binding domain-containing protein [Kordiimonadaceae bacterium]|nr:heme NO-binding domain-containing protein [Kordiimonadaceae bacterium]MBO6570775.1 heme NO-binding domain-containing protein [Kordiimonadaceae bacterium]MBO6965456.1 heme NO-binding domain-containing protein [Kordiimonadaceae bacterium]